MSCILEPALQLGDTGQRIPFLTAVNTITWMVHKEVHYQVKHRLYTPWRPS